jgi:sulfatase maturation enzyme AslB (radical SAM superfamily)
MWRVAQLWIAPEIANENDFVERHFLVVSYFHAARRRTRRSSAAIVDSDDDCDRAAPNSDPSKQTKRADGYVFESWRFRTRRVFAKRIDTRVNQELKSIRSLSSISEGARGFSQSL